MSVSAFLIALIAIFIAAKACGELAERVGQPAVLGELIGGAIVGVSGLRLVDPNAETIHLLAELGVILLLFVIGLETDLKRLISVGGSSTAVAVVGVALPFGGGFGIGLLLGYHTMVAVFLGASLTATSVGITARVLSDLGHLQDTESQIVLGAAVVDDIIGLVLLTVVGTIAEGEELSSGVMLRTTVVAFGFVVLAIVIGSWLAPWLIRAIERLDVARGIYFTSIVFMLALAWIAQSVGSSVIIGAFAAGLVLARTDRGTEIKHLVQNTASFFVPMFFIAVGAAIDVSTINPFHAASRHNFVMGMALALIGIIGKVAAGYVAMQRGIRRVVIGVGMIPRGEVGLIFAQMGLSAKLLDAGTYSAVTLMVITTTFVTPFLLRLLLPQGVPAERAGEDLVTNAPMEDERRGAPRDGAMPAATSAGETPHHPR